MDNYVKLNYEHTKITLCYCSKLFMVLCHYVVHCLYTGSLLTLNISVLSLYGELLHNRRQHSDSYYSSLQ
jgi:hypothetical protein